MDELGRRPGFGTMALRGLAIAGALGFLTLVMVQAAAFYAPPPLRPEAPPRSPRLWEGPTKAAPVIHPPALGHPIHEERLLAPATKAGILGPLRLTPSGAR
jgi:hypothetical protein